MNRIVVFGVTIDRERYSKTNQAQNTDFQVDMNKIVPQAKTDNIVIQNLNDEILIYDLKRNKAFCLNDTLAKIYNLCDGQTDFVELKSKYQFSDDIIYFALDELRKNFLLAESASYESPYHNLSRREIVRKIGLASMIALPVISSLVAPTALNASSGASGGALGSTCADDNQCQSSNCNGGRCCASNSGSNLEPGDQFCTGRDGICNENTCCSGSVTNLGTTSLCSGPSSNTCQCDPYP